MSKPKISVVIPVLNQLDTLELCLGFMFKDLKAELCFIDNGSKPELKKSKIYKKYPDATYIRNDTNVGLSPTLKQGYDATEADIVFFTHNDVYIYEDWHKKILDAFNSDPKLGVVGFGGAYGIAQGAGRLGFKSNMQGNEHKGQKLGFPADVHGARFNDGETLMPAAVLDGFSLIVKRDVIKDIAEKRKEKEWQFFDYLLPHHYYDNELCLQAIKAGWRVAVLNVKCDHQGGVTSVHPDYQEWAKSNFKGQDMNGNETEGDGSIHGENHRRFCQRWDRQKPFGLGVNVKDNYEVDWNV